MSDTLIHPGAERRDGLDRRAFGDDAAYALAIDAIRQASAATTTAALATLKIADHEALCGDRWEQSRRALADLVATVADLSSNVAALQQLFAEQRAVRSQSRGIWGALRDTLAVLSALVAAFAASAALFHH
jgi:hypothetical protein